MAYLSKERQAEIDATRYEAIEQAIEAVLFVKKMTGRRIINAGIRGGALDAELKRSPELLLRLKMLNITWQVDRDDIVWMEVG